MLEQLQGAVFPASTLEREVLAARLPEYRPEDLDLLCSAGEVVWVGHGPLGERDGRLALYLADHLERLLAARPEPPEGDLHQRLRDTLRARGASFFPELQAATGGLARETLEALWDLIWAGEVVSDSPAGLRAFLRGHEHVARLASRRSGRSARAAPRRPRPPGASACCRRGSRRAPVPRPPSGPRPCRSSSWRAGAWSRVTPCWPRSCPAGSRRSTRCCAGSRRAAASGAATSSRGWGPRSSPSRPRSSACAALREGAAGEEQLPGVVLSACDPAQPFGSLLPWPACSARLSRSAGAAVALVDGQLTAFLPRSGEELTTLLPALEPQRARAAEALARALREWLLRAKRSALPCQGVDGLPIARSPLAPFLKAAGFVPYGPGFRLYTAAAGSDAAPSLES